MRDAFDEPTSAAGDALLGAGELARLLGLSISELAAMLRERPFPDPVAWVHRGRAWLRSDVEMFRRGEEPPEREGWDLQREVLALADVASTLGRPVGSLRRHLRLRQWDRIPRPAGRVGLTNYWWRADVERWLESDRHPAAG